MRLTRTATSAFAVVLLAASTAQAATGELSTSNRLQDRREVAAGTRAYAIGFEDGRFYANGWHITGEMGGVWTPPLKLLDGIWFGVDGAWVGPATTFTSGWGYTRFALPPSASGLRLQRTDFVPDGRRAALFGLTLTNPGPAAQTATVMVDAHSELMGAYPWSPDPARNRPTADENIPDSVRFDARRGALQFRDVGSLPAAPGSDEPRHNYAALVASTRRPSAQATGDDFRGPQSPPKVCTGNEKPTPPPPSACDDGPFGRGKGGQLQYHVRIPAGRSRTVWMAVAGSDRGLRAARGELRRVLRNPTAELAAKMASRRTLATWTRVRLPGDRRLQHAIDWGKQNLVDLTQSARNLKIRWTNQGKQFPPPLGTVRRATWYGAGFPDYPWIFATDGEYTAFASVAFGQFRRIEDHLRALKAISDILNNRSGVVVHEAVSNGSIWFGHDSKTTKTDTTTGTTTVTNDFNTDETVKFPSAVALVWRWTGDNRFRDQMYGFAKRNLRYAQRKLDVDNDGFPEGSGNVERSGMGPEKLDNTVYFIRGLYDLADMARSKGDTATVTWATNLANGIRARFESAWWFQGATQYADSLQDPGNRQLFQKHWIGQTPMEAELTIRGRARPGLARHDHGDAALGVRESPTYSGERPFNRGLFHTGVGGGADGKGDLEIFSLTTSIQAVGEGNYGRLGRTQQRRYTKANAETMFSEPATGGTPDEQPGAMPEIFPSPGFRPSANPTGLGGNIDRCFTCRSMFMQAWGNYGTAWSVVHQQLGVRPDLGRGRVDVVPQVPQSRVQGSMIRLGRGWIGVRATHSGHVYTTRVDARRTFAARLYVGHTVPRGSTVRSVTLDGHAVRRLHVRLTNRGLEIKARAAAGARHTLRIVTA